MVQTNRDGFLDSPNRLNVAITRAKFQLVVIGSYEYYTKKTNSEDLRAFAKNTHRL
jgi:superfamily I DNA and/or RNA helicase